MKRLDAYWYSPNPVALALLPVSMVFRALAALRRFAYGWRLLKSHRMPVPVIVVGNITVGGTGKTPVVIAVVERLRQRGYTPGIVSRGYGGSAQNWPQQVRGDSDPFVVGDEPVLLARRCACPLAVGPDRVAAARALLERFPQCDILVSDDGLQHYALARDLEIAVVDGTRRYGNGHFLPAGPLREPPRRLKTVDLVVANGIPARKEYPMRLVPQGLRNVRNEGEPRSLESFRGQRVHAVAGIGDPDRFFAVLRNAGMDVVAHPFADHHAYRAQDLAFGDDLPLVMTEKDMVKCRRFARAGHWYVPVNAQLDVGFDKALGACLDRLEQQRGGKAA